MMLLEVSGLNAQNAFRWLDDLDVKARVNSDGILFMDPGAVSPGWEFPSGSGKNLIFSAGLWIGGFDQAGALHLAAQTYRYGESDFWCGPLNAQTGAPFPASQWDDLWSMNQADIDYHKLNYDQTGYIISSEISEWPGSSYHGVQQIIAPFADTDNNGQYNPSQGDYPIISGQDAVYFVFNDLFDSHTQSSGLPLGIEVYGMAYQVNTNIPALRNTVFVRYRIKNRSVFQYNDLRLGIFVDFDIGNPNDDHYGTRVDKHLLFAENGDATDGTGASGEYGAFPPAAGVTLLSHDAAHTMSWYNSSDATGNPSNLLSVEYYRLMNGRWRDGSPLTFGGSGYQSGALPAAFIFPGDSDPLYGGQTWSCDSSADHRGLISTGPLILSPGGYLTFDVAFTCAIDVPGQSRALLFEYTDLIRAYHQSQVNVVVESSRKENDFLIAPNPSNGAFSIRSMDDITTEAEWRIYNLCGEELMNGSFDGISSIIDATKLNAGVYLLQLNDLHGRTIFRRKLTRL
jgi:hypothetical protein